MAIGAFPVLQHKLVVFCTQEALALGAQIIVVDIVVELLLLPCLLVHIAIHELDEGCHQNRSDAVKHQSCTLHARY